jgi:putative IMPACT (imprinted ancient) family translation regulator
LAGSEEFRTLAGPAESETRERGSVFLAVAAPVTAEVEARALLAERARARFDATHHCSAWRLRDGVWRANDAGEPSGSAGAPILAAIDGAGLLDCAVVVTRYYGGTRLGVGGLIRAYGEAAADALARAPVRVGVPAERVLVRYPYHHTSLVMRALERFGGTEVEYGYAEGGAAGEVEFTLPLRLAAGLRDHLREQSAGELEALRRGERVVYRAPDGPPGPPA